MFKFFLFKKKCTLHTVNYIIGIIHDLLPLEDSLENELISQIISCLTQTKVTYHDYENESGVNGHVSLLNTTNRLKNKQYIILHKLIKDLANKPFVLSDKTLGKSNFRKKSVTYSDLADYAEEVMDMDTQSGSKYGKANGHDNDDFNYGSRSSTRGRSSRNGDY